MLSATIRKFENLASSHKSLMKILKRSGTPVDTSYDSCGCCGGYGCCGSFLKIKPRK
jgi:hypothetical protein